MPETPIRLCETGVRQSPLTKHRVHVAPGLLTGKTTLRRNIVPVLPFAALLVYILPVNWKVVYVPGYFVQKFTRATTLETLAWATLPPPVVRRRNANESLATFRSTSDATAIKSWLCRLSPLAWSYILLKRILLPSLVNPGVNLFNRPCFVARITPLRVTIPSAKTSNIENKRSPPTTALPTERSHRPRQMDRVVLGLTGLAPRLRVVLK